MNFYKDPCEMDAEEMLPFLLNYPGWISVTDRLPQKNAIVAIYRNTPRLWTVAFHLAGGRFHVAVPTPTFGEFSGVLMDAEEDGITHWFDPATLPINNLQSILNDECSKKEQGL